MGFTTANMHLPDSVLQLLL